MGAIRKLYASEIECRVAQCGKKGDGAWCSILLYKDARVDMKILDEVFGPMNWQREHTIIGDNLYCTIKIYDESKGEWISKQDVGTESFTEKEKGQASDSFKRAGFNVGIGRELYTAPFIWVSADKTDIYRTQRGVLKCRDEFSVSDITIKDKKIVGLQIVNKQGNVVYTMGKTENKPKAESKKEDKPKNDDPMAIKFEPVLAELRRTGYGAPAVCKTYNLKKLSDMTDEQIKEFLEKMANVPTKEAS